MGRMGLEILTVRVWRTAWGLKSSVGALMEGRRLAGICPDGGGDRRGGANATLVWRVRSGVGAG